jgi:hypothetical protein
MIQLKEFENCFNQFNAVKGGRGEASFFYYYPIDGFIITGLDSSKLEEEEKKKGVLLSYSNSSKERERERDSV